MMLIRGDGPGEEQVRETVAPHGRGARAPREGFTACLPNLFLSGIGAAEAAC
jgi:hypothetical protein